MPCQPRTNRPPPAVQLGAAIGILAGLVVAAVALHMLSARKQRKLSTQHQPLAAAAKPGTLKSGPSSA
jgi:hypothetical protein